MADSVQNQPGYFHIDSLLTGQRRQISVAIEKCQLCGGSKRCFYCTSCVNKGDFEPSNVRQAIDAPIFYGQRYKDKYSLLQKRLQERRHLQNRVEVESKHYVDLKKQVSDIQLARKRNDLLSTSIKEARAQLEKEKDTLKKLTEENKQRQGKASRHTEKTRRILRYTDKSRQHSESTAKYVDGLQGQLQAVRKQLCTDLVHYIFPIRQEQSKSITEHEGHEEGTIDLLAEARMTSYVKGRWVVADNGGEQYYRIVSPTLPGNGDYSAYLIWSASNRESGASSQCIGATVAEGGDPANPVATLGAALQYTAQLTGSLALLLDVSLPYRLGYGDFGGELDEDRFYKLMFRLNSNVLQLLFSQCIFPEPMQATHTMHNIMRLLQANTLGRSGPFDVPGDLMTSFEESHYAHVEEEEVLSEAGDLRDGGDIEWEQVPASLPEAEQPPSFYTSTQVSQRTSYGSLGTSTSGSIMSSAAAFLRFSYWSSADRK